MTDTIIADRALNIVQRLLKKQFFPEAQNAAEALSEINRDVYIAFPMDVNGVVPDYLMNQMRDQYRRQLFEERIVPYEIIIL